jgi:hypothetical protein
MPAAALLGLVTLLLVPYLGLLVGFAILVLAAATVVSLGGALIATPFLIVRSVRRRQRARTAAGRPPAQLSALAQPLAPRQQHPGL